MHYIKQILWLLVSGIIFSASTAIASEIKTMQMKVGDKEYSVVLNDNHTTKALQEILPMTIKMTEFNGNEKYYQLRETLPSRPEHIGQIKTGDVMLFGDDCLVVFYKDFKATYSYTRIGYIENAADLEQTLGRGSVTITFE
ncbi:MAG: hypothetical protein J6W11_05320 [Alphaproteobacteria bacterium]|nr:hypothetical protein [Alphaproteobacteria bacterium]